MANVMNEELDRAELAVIGAAVLSGGTILEDLDFNPRDFRAPNYEHAYRVIDQMRRDGKPIDAITVTNAVAEDGGKDLALIHRAVDETPSPETAMHYAGIVQDAANRRRLALVGRQITQLAENPGDADTLIEQARKLIDDNVRHTKTEPVQYVWETIEATIDELDSDDNFIPTPWDNLNHIIGGLRPGALYTIGARPSVGKALSLDTKLPTPNGWTTMGEVQPGDQLIGMDGKPTNVVAATDVMTGRKCYRVTFDDGTQIIADAQHQWLTSTRAARKASTPPGGYVYNRTSPFSRDQRYLRELPSIKTTEEIANTIRIKTKEARLNHSVQLTSPVLGEDKNLPLDPYVLGVWLGDGSSWHPTITTADNEVVENIQKAGYPCRPLASKYAYSLTNERRDGHVLKALRELNVFKNKHIPDSYLRASYNQRLRLMQGLMDTDGTVSAVSGRSSFEVTSKALAEGFRELAHTLGLRTSMRTKKVNGRSERSSICYRVGFTTNLPVVTLPRKAERLPKAAPSKAKHRMIVNVEEVESVPVRCVEVDNEDHMYLASESMIPTHNSVVGVQLAQALSQHGSVAFFSLEMSQSDVNKRILSNTRKISMGHLMNPKRLTPQDWEKIADWTANYRQPIAVAKSQSIDLTGIKRFTRNVHRREPLAGIVVDYLQLMAQAPGDGRARQEFVADMSRNLKLLAMDMNVPVIMLSQLNRQSEQRENKAPMLSDLRESGAIEQDSDVVILLHRQISGPGSEDMRMLVAKNRHGAANPASFTFRGHYSEIVDATNHNDF